MDKLPVQDQYCENLHYQNMDREMDRDANCEMNCDANRDVNREVVQQITCWNNKKYYKKRKQPNRDYELLKSAMLSHRDRHAVHTAQTAQIARRVTLPELKKDLILRGISILLQPMIIDVRDDEFTNLCQLVCEIFELGEATYVLLQKCSLSHVGIGSLIPIIYLYVAECVSFELFSSNWKVHFYILGMLDARGFLYLLDELCGKKTTTLLESDIAKNKSLVLSLVSRYPSARYIHLCNVCDSIKTPIASDLELVAADIPFLQVKRKFNIRLTTDDTRLLYEKKVKTLRRRVGKR